MRVLLAVVCAVLCLGLASARKRRFSNIQADDALLNVEVQPLEGGRRTDVEIIPSRETKIGECTCVCCEPPPPESK